MLPGILQILISRIEEVLIVFTILGESSSMVVQTESLTSGYPTICPIKVWIFSAGIQGVLVSAWVTKYANARRKIANMERSAGFLFTELIILREGPLPLLYFSFPIPPPIPNPEEN